MIQRPLRSSASRPPSEGDSRPRRVKRLKAMLALALLPLSFLTLTATPAQADHGAVAPSIMECRAFQPSLRRDQPRSMCVASVQFFLRGVYGSNIVVDGWFGNQTEAYVAWFQATHGLPATGSVGARTWAEIEDWCRSGGPEGPARWYACNARVPY